MSFARCLAHGAYDLVITDDKLGWSTGATVLKTIQSHDPHCPVILFSKAGTETFAVASAFAAVVTGGQVLTDQRSRQVLKSHDFHLSFFENAPVGLCRISPTGSFIEVNPALIELLGYPDRETLLQVNFADLSIDPQEYQLSKSLLERDGQFVRFEQRLRRYDSEEIATRQTAKAVCNNVGQVLYIDGIVEEKPRESCSPSPRPLDRSVGN